jgi:hypothetical protein
VLIISTDLQDQTELLSIAQNHQEGGGFEFETTVSFGQEPSWWQDAKIGLLILDLPEENDLNEAFLRKLKNEVPRELPLIVVSSVVSDTLLELSQIFKKMRILKKPFQAALVYRAVLDTTAEWAPGRRQTQPRHSNYQTVLVSHKGAGQRGEALLRNLSVGGAYFEMEKNDLFLKPTDEITIEIELSGVSKYVFQARIIWSRPLSEGGVGYGCTFLDMDEAFQKRDRSE